MYYIVAVLLLCCLLQSSDSANVLLRGQQSTKTMEELKERVLHPTIKPEHRGKTLEQILGKDVAAETQQQQQQRQRKMQSVGEPTYSYFAVSMRLVHRTIVVDTFLILFHYSILIPLPQNSCTTNSAPPLPLWATLLAYEVPFTTRTLDSMD